MSADHLDPELRAVRAALSVLVGYALPDQAADVAVANGIAVGTWVFPPRPVSLVMPEMGEPGELVPRGAEIIAQAEQAGVRMLVPGDDGWPSGTACDELPCLWVLGDADLAGLMRQAVTVTGARAADAYGRHMAGELAYSLASRGWTLVTADGYGVDHEVARKTHAAGGRVLLISAGSVLAEDHVFNLRPLVADAAVRGAVVSPFPPGTYANRSRWAIQQRLLATMSAGTVIVQATATSRAVDVARLAAQAGRAVCAVPGPVTTELSAGSHRLFDDGIARLVSTGGDVASAIGAHHAHRHFALAAPGAQMFEVSGVVSWQDVTCRRRPLPPRFVCAASPQHAAQAAVDIAFTARPDAFGATLDAAVRGPDATYHTFQATSPR